MARRGPTGQWTAWVSPSSPSSIQRQADHLEKIRFVWEFCYSTHVSEMDRFQDHFDKISQNSVSAAALTTRAQAGPDVKSPMSAKVENKWPEEPRVIGEGPQRRPQAGPTRKMDPQAGECGG